jgi:ribosomal subunit interface protein
MHLYLTARHFDLTDDVRGYVQRRIVDAIAAHAPARELNRVEVQLSRSECEARYTCHVLLQLSAQREVNITEANHDLRAAIDLAEKRLMRSLIDLRQRRRTTTRHAHQQSARKMARGSDAKA